MRRILLISLPVTLIVAPVLAWLWTPWAWLLPLLSLDLMLVATLVPGCQWWGTVLRSFGSRYREVLITFDGAPNEDETPEVLVLLERYGARALFLVDADRVRRAPDLVKEIVQRGHGIGCALTDANAQTFWRMGPKSMEAAIRRGLAAIDETLPGHPVQWFRGPAGLKLPWLHPVLDRCGLKLLGASAHDGGLHMRDIETTLLQMRSAIGKGGVIQFHHGQRNAAGHGTMPEVLEEMLIWLRGQGYGMS